MLHPTHLDEGAGCVAAACRRCPRLFFDGTHRHLRFQSWVLPVLGLALACIGRLAAADHGTARLGGDIATMGHPVTGDETGGGGRRRLHSASFTATDKLVVATVQSEGTAAQIRGYRFWADATNEQGGMVVGATRLKVELRVYDDLGDASRRQELYQQIAATGEADAIFTPSTAALNASYTVTPPSPPPNPSLPSPPPPPALSARQVD